MSSLAIANPTLPRLRPITHPGIIVALMWLGCCAVMLWLFRADLTTLGFHDPDDAMRLQQVRDWVAGQGWFDVNQHRVNPPLGGPMHWSRIVDMPVAALMLLAGPLIGAAKAEILACILVPLLLLAGLSYALYLAARRIGGRPLALVTLMLLLTAPSILIQFTPLRIDHHGWQIAMAALALAGMMDTRALRGGIVAGGALAVWLQISSESLPYVALFTGTLALWQWLRPAETPRFIGFAVTVGGLALPLLVSLRGPSAPFQTQCDALSAAYLWPLVAFAMATPAAYALLGTGTARRRFLIAAIGGGAAIATLALTGGPCLSGDPFQSLGPVAYRYWYIHILEGRPIWEQDLARAGSIILPPIAGLVGTLLAAWRDRADRTALARWLVLALLLTGASAIAIMVMRALSVAHVLALPGMAWIILMLFWRAQASPRAIVRVLGSTALILLTPAGLCALWIAATSGPDAPSIDGAVKPGTQCQPGAQLAPLVGLPHGTIFAPMDIGPTILIRTDHDVVATGHHRNAVGITAVIQGFMATPAAAHAVIGRLNGGRGADYVVTCTDLNEMKGYVEAAPHGLAAALNAGRVPAWLHPLPGGGALHIYKVVDQPGTKAIATPFIQ